MNAATAITSVGSEADALRIARALVDDRAAACVSISGPVRSIYQWNGSIRDEKEWGLLIKAPASAMPALEEKVRAMHPYKTPEWLVFFADYAAADYLAWLTSETQPSPTPLSGTP